MRRAARTALYDSTRKRGETLRQVAQRREQEFDQAAQREGRRPSAPCLKEEPRCRNRVCRLRGRASLDAQVVADAVRTLDLAGMPVTRSPNRLLAAILMISESDEEVFANLDRLDLNKDEALVLCGAQSKTWSVFRYQKESAIPRERDCRRPPSVPTVESAGIGIASVPSHPARSLEPSSLRASCSEGRGCSCQQSRSARSRR